MNKKILFISYVFPPTGGAGIQRTVKLVKYFHRLGWEPYVLTAKNPSVPVFDYEMLKDIPVGIKIFKSFSLEIPYALKRYLWSGTVKGGESKKEAKPETAAKATLKSKIINSIKFFIHFIMMPDPQVGWNYFTRKKIKKIIRKHKINYVFISAPPFSSLLLIPGLSKLGVKVIADFRDEWTEFYLKSYDFHQRDNYTEQKIIQMEKTVIESSTLVTMATTSFVKNYAEKYNEPNKIKLLTNGFDEEDFADIKPEKKNGHEYNITYTGTIFNVTTARFLLQAFSNLFNEYEELKEKTKLTFVGRVTDEEKPYFDKYEFQKQITMVGYVSHEESISYLNNSDLLVVIVDEMDGSDRIIAAKIFEYIYSRIPILALVPEDGEIARIVNSTKTGIVVSNRKIAKIEEILRKLINGEFTFKPDEKELNKYSRQNIALNLIGYLKEL